MFSHHGSVDSQTCSVVTDFLVLGGGVAGLQVALHLAQAGEVIILNKGKGIQGSSQYAQGGIAAALGGPADRESHFQDTLRAGAGLCNRRAVRVLVREGPQRIRELIERGVQFDRQGSHFLYAQEATHSRPRVLRAKGDATGEEIVRTLIQALKQTPRIRLLEGHFILDLLTSGRTCLGAVAINEQTGQPVSFRAKSTVLATGGAGMIYLRTTNPSVATGDGFALAYRSGAVLEDMEFIQFHPTALTADHAPPFLLTEALRGEGAVLRNKKGEAFMIRYDPAADLAPRDVVSRAICSEMNSDRLAHVTLDLTHLDRDFLIKRFPMIHKTCLSFGLDFTREGIPVSPAAHFMIGGVKTDLFGRTNLPGLLAVGEVACTQVHGANRLGSNSLLEGLVFGARAAKAAASRSLRKGGGTIPRQGTAGDHFGMGIPSDRELLKIQHEIRRLAWEKVGVVRSGEPLREALRMLRHYEDLLAPTYPSRLFMETKNLATVARLVTQAALKRRGSIGVHFRADDPGRSGSGWRRHATLRHRHSAASRPG